MFTGLIEACGKVAAKGTGRGRLAVALPPGWRAAKGGSIAVNGVCLTAASSSADAAIFDVSPETYEKSTLGALRSGDLVNLERPLRAGGNFDGHLVTGHVDGVAHLVRLAKTGNCATLRFEAGPDLMPEIARKGSVALDGISLTISAVSGRDFEVSVIPSTLERTTLRLRKAGDALNIETDILAKYVRRTLGQWNENRITPEFLKKNGF